MKEKIRKRKPITDPELLKRVINEIIKYSNNEMKAFIKKNRDVCEFALSCDNKTYKRILSQVKTNSI